MPFDISVRFGYPKQDAVEQFGGGEGRLWGMLAEIADLLDVLVNGSAICSDEKLSVGDKRAIVERINRVLNERLVQEDPSLEAPVHGNIEEEPKDSWHTQSVDHELPTQAAEEEDRASRIAPSNDVKASEESLIFGYLDGGFQEKAIEIAKNYTWNEAIPLLAAEILQSGAIRTKTKAFQFADATKAFILATRFAGFKFLNPNHGDMARHFFFNLIEKRLVKEAPWMAKFPAKPFSSMAANHPEYFVKKPFIKPGSTREFTAYGLTMAGYEAYRSDMMKLGIRKGDLEVFESIIRDIIDAPVYDYPDLYVDPDDQEPAF